MRLSVDRLTPLAVLALLSACGTGEAMAALPPSANGPAADYPVVIGEPFTVEGVTYTPDDRLNYDETGFAGIAPSGDNPDAVSGSHKTLPLPSYVEVTSLESGRTILVRLENRGPMANDRLIDLSPGAAAQLGIVQGACSPVRVRRVNPPEPERAMLRAGARAPERMATPASLLKVLNRKLAEEQPLKTCTTAAAGVATPEPQPAAIEPEKIEAEETAFVPAPDAAEIMKPEPVPVPQTTAPEPVPEPTLTPEPAATPVPAPTPTPAPAPKASQDAGRFTVQVAAFSTEQRADAAAAKLGAKVVKPGKYWLMRLGPFTTRAEAVAALEKAKAAGYRDARIQSAD